MTELTKTRWFISYDKSNMSNIDTRYEQSCMSKSLGPATFFLTCSVFREKFLNFLGKTRNVADSVGKLYIYE